MQCGAAETINPEEEEREEKIPVSPLYTLALSYKSYYHSRLAFPCPIQPLDTDSNINEAVLFTPRRPPCIPEREKVGRAVKEDEKI